MEKPRILRLKQTHMSHFYLMIVLKTLKPLKHLMSFIFMLRGAQNHINYMLILINLQAPMLEKSSLQKLMESPIKKKQANLRLSISQLLFCLKMENKQYTMENSTQPLLKNSLTDNQTIKKQTYDISFIKNSLIHFKK